MSRLNGRLSLVHRTHGISCITTLLGVFIAVSISISQVKSVKLDENGHYDIVIAISEKTAQNQNEDYLQNLKSSIQDLGDALSESTKGNFSIRSADIVLPSHWDVETDGFATSQTFQNSDIRISHEFLVPQAINPLFCGYPGHYIELPYSFFDKLDNGPYGPSGKALLTLWARYRWGVHEEHGFPGDFRFPYFWRARRLPDDPEDTEDEWRVTNCANAELEGNYENLDGDEPCEPNPDGGEDESVYPPPNSCRFFPEIENQNATTSLMSFPFIKSLLEFCDADTHNTRGPTRQNHFCHYKSVWEVIRESPDWAILKEDRQPEKSRIQFRILKQSERPLLFVLTEGVNVPPPEVIAGVSTGLDDIFNQTVHWNVAASVGVFPGLDWKDSFDTLYPWDFPWYDRAKLTSSFNSSFGSRSGFRPFAAAIQDVGNYIKERRHPHGAVILIVKCGSESYGSQAYFQAFEGEVLATVLEQNIKIFAIEGKDDQAKNSYRLQQLVELSVGVHFQIGEDPTENAVQVAEAMRKIDDALKTGIPYTSRRVVNKEIRIVPAFTYDPIPLHINQENIKSVKFYFHQLVTDYYNTSMTPPTFTAGPDTIAALPSFQEYTSWGQNEIWLKSYMASLDEGIEQSTYWEYMVECYLSECAFLMIAIAEVDEAASQLTSTLDVHLSVSTSADIGNSVVDLVSESAASLKGTAFAIYAKLEKNGHPINNPEIEVKAHVQLFLRDPTELTNLGFGATVINLIDDGWGAPDMTEGDGIYSGNYIPSDYLPNGDLAPHQIFVTAQLKAETKSKSAPLPVDQVAIRCGSGWGGCWSETVIEPFMVFAELKQRVEFNGTEDYVVNNRGAASRIIDLRVEPSQNQYANEYELLWTEPFVQVTTMGLVEDNMGKNWVDRYQMFYTENFHHISNPLRNEDLSEIPGSPFPGSPGSIKRFELGHIEPGKKYYYVVRAWGKDAAPASPTLWSNVAFLHSADPYVTTTTTTSTPPTPSATSSTTKIPTKEPRTTTVPSLTSTTAFTTPTTTWATPSTTRAPTTTPTTPVTTTTRKYEPTKEPVKYWYRSVGAIATFSVFSVLFVSLIGGGLVYHKFFKG